MSLLVTNLLLFSSYRHPRPDRCPGPCRRDGTSRFRAPSWYVDRTDTCKSHHHYCMLGQGCIPREAFRHVTFGCFQDFVCLHIIICSRYLFRTYVGRRLCEFGASCVRMLVWASLNVELLVAVTTNRPAKFLKYKLHLCMSNMH